MSFPFLQGEFRRSLDDRFRLSIPAELADSLVAEGDRFVLVKEAPGALSLWEAGHWQQRHDQGLQLIRSKLEAGRLAGRLGEVQRMGRMLSTRHVEIRLAGRGRIVIPEGFREFLGVPAGGDVMIVGAALCVEFWRPDAWIDYVGSAISDFPTWWEELSA